MAAAKNKIGFIAAARCIGILLVVFGHSYPFDVYISSSLWKIKDFIYIFHMPLFLFLSGYLLTFNTRPAGAYIRRRGVRLLVPYFVLSAIAFVPKALVQQYLNDSVELSFRYLLKTELIPRDNVWGHFWYIPVLFHLSCLGVLMLKPLRKYHAAGWTLLAASYFLLFAPRTTDWLALEDLRKTAFYFSLGMVIADKDPEMRVVNNWCWLLAFPAAITLFVLANTVLINSVIACLMIGFILHIGNRFPLNEESFLSAIEKNSYSIFLLSWPVQAVIEVVCNRILHFPVLATMGLMFCGGIMVPLICVEIIFKLEKRMPLKWLKLMIGM